MEPRHIAHVFPYHPAQIHEDLDSWRRGQELRWPLAALAGSRYADRTSVHLMWSRRRRFRVAGVEAVTHRELLGGPRWWAWGDDWSWSLERALQRLGHDDVCVIHLNWFWAAHVAQRAARRCRVVVVVHGTDLGPWDVHPAAADAIVVIRADHVTGLSAMGARPGQVVRMVPSLDKDLFHQRPHPPTERSPRRLGFIGRVSREKGVFELPAVVRAARDAGIATVVDIVGKGDDAAVREFTELCTSEGVADSVRMLGSLTPPQVAEAMRGWDLFLMPSWYEGGPITTLEACACGVPVAAVAGVMSPDVEARQGIWTSSREDYSNLVVRALQSGSTTVPDRDWIPTHEQGASAWDDVIDGLPAWQPHALPPRRRAARWARFRGRLGPLRQALARAGGD